MPDPVKIVKDPTPADMARAKRILELSQQWNVPTKNILSTTKMGPKSYNLDAQGKQRQLPQSQTFYTFDAQGNVNNQITDYNEEPGISYYTPADIELQKQYPGQGMTVNRLNLDPNGTPVNQMVNTPVSNVLAKTKGNNMKWGGKSKGKKKAQMGATIPNPDDPQNPYSLVDDLTPIYADNMRMQAWSDINPVYSTPQDPNIPSGLQNPTPNLQTTPVPSSSPSSITKKGKGIQFGSVNLNIGSAIAGFAGIANQAFEQANVAQQAARNQRLTLQQENYNPFSYGTGSQAIYKNGGKVPDQVYDLSKDQIKKLEAMGYIIEKIK